ncbi:MULTISPECIES: DUF2569 domain-containing protein [unclassified Gilliamella]|uniref:DUF2569 domain-containing protein n=1 Tax=unclassified Gilliamella TaxID=2685620 RepID=UPI0013079D69|nr:MULTISPECIES: DUF2569 domain-containing protein [unclassified Gilliamella]MWP48406.1 DUF2569 family protein [Gilliamella sp. Lep-s35]MWP68315.1 DUF2569 family protein [Gilliamella sp. Lep-s5]MWP76546.1 DUF2569 family protein [Gilliamella sp. Lep-s21]
MAEQKELKGLGGWLIIVAIGLILTFVLLAVHILDGLNSIVFSGLWSQLTDPNSEDYTPNFAWIFLFEIIGNSLFFIVNGYLTYLFFTKNYKFPTIFIAFEIINIAFVLLNSFFCNSILSFNMNGDTIENVAKAVIHAGIWIPYMLKSVRVKNTFVNGRCNEVPHSDTIS